MHGKNRGFTRHLVIVAVVVALVLATLTTAADAGELDRLFEKLNRKFKDKLEKVKQTQLGETKIGQGLREALETGINNAVDLTGTTNGFFGNTAIRIPLPDKLRKVEKFLRSIGYDKRVDKFVLSMNRAAEKAAPFARDIFIEALMAMTFDDARGILGGGDTAATNYFKGKTHGKLVEVFTPPVIEALNGYDVTRKYRALFGRFQSLPFLNLDGNLDIEHYVVGKALDGLFHMLGEEERKIRTDPAARVTELLKEVFK